MFKNGNVKEYNLLFYPVFIHFYTLLKLHNLNKNFASVFGFTLNVLIMAVSRFY